jgi:hypothetical protein
MRMRAHWFRRLVVIGSRAEIELRSYRSRMAPKAVLHTLAAWEVRFDLAIYYFPTAEAAALQVESWTWWAAREILRNANNLVKGCQEAVPAQSHATH